MLRNRAAALCLTFGVTTLGMIAPYLLAQVRTNTQIVANVELVQIPVVVFDDKGAVATSLKKNDFRILDDGVEQKVLYCERERVPVSFVILADVSSSMTRKLPFVQEAALSLLDPPDQKGQSFDEFSVLGIETRAKMLMPFTRDQHRAMIIISDGGDNHSRYNLYETKHMLEEADIPTFAVMAGSSFELPAFLAPQPKKHVGPGTRRGGPLQFPDLRTSGTRDDYIGPAELRGPHNLKTLTEASGGGVFTAGQMEDLPRIVRTIGQAVRYRYVLTYQPIRDPKAAAAGEKTEGDPNRHKIRVELFPKEKFKGFYLPYYKRNYRSFQ